jgi:hypothetical protein
MAEAAARSFEPDEQPVEQSMEALGGQLPLEVFVSRDLYEVVLKFGWVIFIDAEEKHIDIFRIFTFCDTHSLPIDA